jgi:hypothetical protein
MTRKISRGDDDVSVVQQVLNDLSPQVSGEADKIAGPVGPIALGCGYIRFGVEIELQVAGLAPEVLAWYLRQLAAAIEAHAPLPAMTKKPPPDTDFTKIPL